MYILELSVWESFRNLKNVMLSLCDKLNNSSNNAMFWEDSENFQDRAQECTIKYKASTRVFTKESQLL